MSSNKDRSHISLASKNLSSTATQRTDWILIDVPRTIYNPHIVDALCKLDVSKYKALKLATKVHNHASELQQESTKHTIQLSNSNNGGLGGGDTEWTANRKASRTLDG
eukprot:1151602-Pelagomonas_calceolata.AAC.3